MAQARNSIEPTARDEFRRHPNTAILKDQRRYVRRMRGRPASEFAPNCTPEETERLTLAREAKAALVDQKIGERIRARTADLKDRFPDLTDEDLDQLDRDEDTEA